jgi:hypothetical protein
MHIALVLYGQPRDYRKGHAAIRAFLDRQTDCTVDVFYHVWSIGEHQTYAHSPWRTLSASELTHTDTAIAGLAELYSPRASQCENQTTVTLDTAHYLNTIAYRSMSAIKQRNLSNTLYQMLSRTRARDLVATYVAETQTHYDTVLMVRFDIGTMPDVVLSTLDLTKTYVSDLHRPRSILPDNCLLTPLSVFLSWMQIHPRLPELAANGPLADRLRRLKESLELNPEEVLLAAYLASGHSLAEVRYFRGGLV